MGQLPCRTRNMETIVACHNQQGCDLLKKGKPREAIGEFLRAIEIDPRSPEAYRYMGSAYEDLGLWEKAQHAYEQLVRLRPDDARAYYSLGMAYKNLSQWGNAVECFDKGRRLSMDYPV